MNKPKYITDKIGNLITFNPSETLRGGTIAKKIAMEKLVVGQRQITGFEYGTFSSGAKFRNGDTLLAKITPCLENGKTAQVDILEDGEVAFGSTEFIVLRESDKMDSDYIFYLARSPYFRQIAISCMEGTSGRKRVSESSLQNRSISVPENIKEQQKIASVLSALDKKIELNNKIIKELETMSKELYDYWFVQFDFPNKDGKPYRSSGGAMTYNPTLKREIPLGWEVNPIQAWTKDEIGGDWGSDEPKGNLTIKVACIRGADINSLNGKTNTEIPIRYINKDNTDKILTTGDIIIEISGGSTTQSTGRIAAISDAAIRRFEAPLICTNFCKAITLRNKVVMYNFLFEWERAYNAGVLFGFEGKTSGIKNFLYDSFVSSFRIPFPPKELCQEFQYLMSDMDDKKHKALQENQELTTLRDWLLPMLMNGQVTIQSEQSQSTKSECVTVDLIRPREIPIDAHILGGHIVNRLHKSSGFGRTKLMKCLHLVENCCQMPLNSQSVRQTAGPFDNQMMSTIEQKFKQYNHVKIYVDTKGGKKHYTYAPTAMIDDIEQAFEKYPADKIALIDALLDKLNLLNLNQIEVVSTLYAVWNNRIIKSEPIDDNMLLTDFYAWSKHKSDFSQEFVLQQLAYMRSENVIPIGWGAYIDKI